MMMHTTLNQLRSLRLESMAQALEQQLTQSGLSAMSFEERFALLVDREVHGRSDRRCARLLKVARLKYPQAAIEDLDSRAGRGLERSAVMSLALGEWVNSGHAVLITGPAGAGKSWRTAGAMLRRSSGNWSVVASSSVSRASWADSASSCGGCSMSNWGRSGVFMVRVWK